MIWSYITMVLAVAVIFWAVMELPQPIAVIVIMANAALIVTTIVFGPHTWDREALAKPRRRP